MNIYEQILAGLRTKFTGADDATLQRIASKRSEGVTDESKVNSIVEGVSFADVMNNYGDYRADGAQKTAVANYEKKHNIKDGKPIEEPKPAPAPAPVPNPTPTPAPAPAEPKPAEKQNLTAEAIAEMISKGVTEGIAAGLKPIQERLDRQDAAAAQAAFDAKVEGVAKSFGIPEFAYKGKTIQQDADLNQYFTDLKQEMQNAGFQFSAAPQSGNQPQEGKDGEVIAGLINDGTKELSEKK